MAHNGAPPSAILREEAVGIRPGSWPRIEAHVLAAL